MDEKDCPGTPDGQAFMAGSERGHKKAMLYHNDM